MDLNHPLSGKDIRFAGHIIETRDATNEEIQNAINAMSGEGGEHHCCCGHHHGEEGEHECHCHDHEGESGEHHCHCHDND
jgi:FKBP-type peptidyl-prolyl cis-trans isomerase SlyD